MRHARTRITTPYRPHLSSPTTAAAAAASAFGTLLTAAAVDFVSTYAQLLEKQYFKNCHLAAAAGSQSGACAICGACTIC